VRCRRIFRHWKSSHIHCTLIAPFYPLLKVSKLDNLVEASLFDGPPPKLEEKKMPTSITKTAEYICESKQGSRVRQESDGDDSRPCRVK